MAIKTVLFDLDGTLLPMNQDEFVKAYFGGLAKKAALAGLDPERTIKAIGGGVLAMTQNDGTRSNEDAFWLRFDELMGGPIDRALFDEYYANDFQLVRGACGFAPRAAELVKTLRRAGLRVVLATNPLFPQVATFSRIRWAGLEPEDFEFVTTYENSTLCKPNPGYYREIVERLGLDPAECLMVGNDVGEDMVAERLGMRVFLLTDCLINKDGADISSYPHGDFDAMCEFVLRTIGE